MNTYTVLFAIDVPHYCKRDIEAENDEAAIAAAGALYNTLGVPCYDPEWDNTGCARIVYIDDPGGETVAHDIPLDDCFIRYGGEAERLLCENAKEMLAALECAIVNEEGNWDGPDDEPEWLRQARVVTSKTRGQA